jgi:hypothetical protein
VEKKNNRLGPSDHEKAFLRKEKHAKKAAPEMTVKSLKNKRKKNQYASGSERKNFSPGRT